MQTVPVIGGRGIQSHRREILQGTQKIRRVRYQTGHESLVAVIEQVGNGHKCGAVGYRGFKGYGNNTGFLSSEGSGNRGALE